MRQFLPGFWMGLVAASVLAVIFLIMVFQNFPL